VLDVNSAARTKEIRPGMDVPQARNLAQDCRFTPWREEAYADRQRDWLDVCTDYSGGIEPIDQHIAALDLTGHGNPIDIAERVVRALVTRVGLPLRYGSAGTKWVAKLAAHRDDTGLAATDPSSFLAGLPTSDLLPVSPESRERLVFLGYPTIGQVAKIPLSVLLDQFGQESLTISQAVRGGCAPPVAPLYPRDALVECFHFETAVEDGEVIWEVLSRLAKRIARRFHGRQGSLVELSIETEDGRAVGQTRRFTRPLHDLSTVLAALRALFPLLSKEGKGVTMRDGSADEFLDTADHRPDAVSSMRIVVRDLEFVRPGQKFFFEPTSASRQSEAAVSEIRNTYGEGAVRLASEIELSRRQRVLREWREATGWR
jgi:DNA polymerase-4